MQQLFGIYEKAFPDVMCWQERIAIAKRAGYDFIEFSVDESDGRLARLSWSKSERQALRRLFENEGLKLLSMCLSGHRRYPFGSRDPAVRAKAREIMSQAIELAEDLGIRNIQLAGYDVYYEPHDTETERWFEEGLWYAADLAARANIMLSIEVMDTPFLGTVTACRRFVDRIQSPWLKIYPDLGNLSQWSESPALELAKGADAIVAIHLKDTKPGVFKGVPFGEGTVDFRGLFKALKALNYKGPYMVEMWADNSAPLSPRAVEQQIKDAKAWLIERM